jgi:P-type conjugative transfer protein TrbJ
MRCLARSNVVVVLSVMVTAVGLISAPAHAWFEFPYFVLDAARLAERARTVQEQAEQVNALRIQVENEAKMLRSLDFSTLAGVTQGMRRVEDILHRAGAYDRANPQPRMDRQYPLDWTGMPDEQVRYELLRDQLLANQRSAMTNLRTLQNGVVLEMPAVESRVAELMQASNTAAGMTSAVQARNQLQTELIAEIQKLQALRLTRTRLRSEQQAEMQSDDVRARRTAEWLRRDGTVPPVPQEPGVFAIEPIPVAVGR